MAKLKKLSQLKNKILSTRNRRSAAQMSLIHECSEALKIEKQTLIATGQPATWDHFVTTQAFTEVFNGIDQSTIAIAERLWGAL